MADALVAPAVAGTMYAFSTVAAGYSIKKVKLEDETKKIPIMGVMGAFVFAAQMINFTIPGTGSSGHISGGMLLSALLGPYAGFLTMIGVLLIQCLLFADGGLLALGCNVWNMAFYGCFVGALVLWKLIMRNGITKRKITIASILGCILTLQMGAFSVTLETLASGVTDLPFGVFVAAMQPIHLAIGLVEGLITSAVLSFIYEARPELLWSGKAADSRVKEKTGRISFRNTMIILFAAFVVIGGGLSIFASTNPDGLEWSIQRITGSAELPVAGAAYSMAEKIQSLTAVLPDYAFKNSDSVLGTSISGILGGIIVIVFCTLIAHLLRLFKRKEKHEQN